MSFRIISICFSLIFFCGCNDQKKGETADKDGAKNVIEIKIKPNITESKPTDNEKRIYFEAYNTWYNGNPNLGIKKLKKFIVDYPKSSLSDDAQRMIGTCYSNLENYKKAIEEYKKVKINYPNSNSTPPSIYDMAHLYFFSLNDFKEAKYYYQEFIGIATEEDRKFRDIAVDQLKHWDEETKRFEGYAENRKEDKKNVQANNPKEYLEILQHSWKRGGFKAVGLHSLSIKNSSNVTYKDVILKFDYFSETNVLLGTSSRTVYKYFPSNKTIQVNEINTGFIPADAKESRIEIITAAVNN